MKATIANFLTSVLPNFQWTPGALGFGIVLLFGLGTGHVLLAKGELPWLYPGFVPRTEFVQVTVSIEHMADKMDATRRSELRAQMRQDFRRVCQALAHGRPADIYEEAIDQAQEEYGAINNGAAYALNRDCGAVAK